MTESHPTSLELEASHAEGRAGPLEPHLAACDVCRAFLDGLQRERAAFLAARPAAPFVRAVRKRVMLEQQEVAGHRGWLLQLVPLLAVLVMLELVHSWPSTENPAASVESERSLDELAAPLSHSSGSAPPGGAPTPAADVVAKGGGGPALIVKRAGSQWLSQGVAAIVPGDELRLRFELTRPGLVEAGILMRGGEWVPFFSGYFTAGQHTPDATLRVDDEPSSGTLLVGAPADVARARAGSPAEVQALSLEWSRHE